MTRQEIKELINKSLKGQGTAVDISGKLPAILGEIVNLTETVPTQMFDYNNYIPEELPIEDYALILEAVKTGARAELRAKVGGVYQSRYISIGEKEGVILFVDLTWKCFSTLEPGERWATMVTRKLVEESKFFREIMLRQSETHLYLDGLATGEVMPDADFKRVMGYNASDLLSDVINGMAIHSNVVPEGATWAKEERCEIVTAKMSYGEGYGPFSPSGVLAFKANGYLYTITIGWATQVPYGYTVKVEKEALESQE